MWALVEGVDLSPPTKDVEMQGDDGPQPWATCCCVVGPVPATSATTADFRWPGSLT
jgi:hypothetical protein